MSIELNDEEIRKVNEIQRRLQERFAKTAASYSKIAELGMMAETWFHDEVGLEVQSTVERIQHPQYGEIWVPSIEITGRVNKALEEVLKKETDHERKRWDAMRSTREEDAKNIHLLD